MKRTSGFGLTLLILTCFALEPPDLGHADPVPLYIGLETKAHLRIADRQLDDRLREADADGAREQSRCLREAQALVRQAIEAYARYERPEPNSVWIDADPPPARAEPEYPPSNSSPLAPLEHLHLAMDHAVQQSVAFRISSVPRSEVSMEPHRALDESIRHMEEAIRVMESAGGWVVDFSGEGRLMLSMPPGFQSQPRLKSELLRRIKSTPDGAPEKIVFLRRTVPGREAMERGPETYRQGRIEEMKQRFPEMTVVELGDSQSTPDGFTTSYVYRHQWQSDALQAVLHIRGDGDQALEIHYVALADRFDRRESDQIAGSVRDVRADTSGRTVFRMATADAEHAPDRELSLVDLIVGPELNRREVKILGKPDLVTGELPTYRADGVWPVRLRSPAGE